MRINLGDKVKDSVTGFEGIAIARTEWLHGCFRILVQPQKLTKDGAPHESLNVDEPQLTVVGVKRVKNGSRTTGGPMPSPMRKKDAAR